MARGTGYSMVNGFPRMNTGIGIHMRLIGVRQLQANLNKKIAQINGVTYRGLAKAAAHIQRVNETVPPLTPLGETGHLRQSWTVRPVMGKPYPVIEAGYMEGYAPYVHEMTVPPYTKPINWSRPGSGAKWFEIALQTNTKTMLQIIRQEVQTVI